MTYRGDTNSIINSVCQNGAPKDVPARAHDSTTVKPILLVKRNTGAYATGFEVNTANAGTGNSGSAAIFQVDISAASHPRSNVAYDKTTLYTLGDKVPVIQHERGKTYKMKQASASVAVDKYLVTGALGVVIAHDTAHDATPQLLHAYLTVRAVTSTTEIEAIYLGEVYLYTTTT